MRCEAIPFATIDNRAYWRCAACVATFLDAAQLPSPSEEQAHYAWHENHPTDPGYRRFLAKLAVPLLERLSTPAQGLDYGCGPGPALAAMLQEAGHAVRLYDPFYHPDESALFGTYDFITCTEVAEHFHRPAEEFARLDAMLRPGGYLAIMTCFQDDDAHFASWHYRRDPTHVVFYRAETFHFLARHFRWEIGVPVKDVALMRKVPAT